MLFFGFSFRIQYFERKSSILEKMGQLEGAISHKKGFEKGFLTFHSRQNIFPHNPLDYRSLYPPNAFGLNPAKGGHLVWRF